MAVARVLLLLVAVRLGSGEDFRPERTRLMDVSPPNSYLFRGNMPVINGSFAYSNVTSTMRKILQVNNHSLPSNFTLIDISYMNVFNYPDFYTEIKFIKEHPWLGEYHNYLIVGNFFKPPQNDPKEIQSLLPVMLWDDMPHVLEKMHVLLTQQSGPALLYSHCEAGTDRTGQVSGGYYLKYLNMSFPQALNIDNHIQGRPMYDTSRNALQWYCYHLYYKENYTHLNCTLPD